jgi:hypothetical protein
MAETNNSSSHKLNWRISDYSELIYGSLRKMDMEFKWMPSEMGLN